MKIVTVVGARPQFIKAAMVSPEIRKNHEEVLVHTGQHYDFQMSQVFFDELEIPEPDYNLGIGSDSHARQTARAMMALEEVLLKENPDMVLVYGDTNSTVAAALTASKMHLPIAHVEAGPRMGHMRVPEEINRVVTDHLSSLLFAPTQTSVENLTKEGIVKGVHFTGDVMYDAFLRYALVAQEKSNILERLNLSRKEFVYATVHRAVNTDDPTRLAAIVKTLCGLEMRVVFPIHPRTRRALQSAALLNALDASSNVTALQPLGYFDSLRLTIGARAVVTDSGGVQREAYFARVPCITIDESTAWVETVESGWNALMAPGSSTMRHAILRADTQREYPLVFGTGAASSLVASIVMRAAN
jgi:UDP-N-acetylglucosamine 2-epimerase